MAIAPRRPFFRRRKSRPFSGANAPKIDYKDTCLLSIHFRARQDRTLPHHRGERRQAARARAGDQARPVPGPPAKRDPLTIFGRRRRSSKLRTAVFG